MTLGGQQTITETTTVDANIGVSLEGVTIGGGASSSDSTANTVSKTISYTVPPGRQAVFVAGTAQQSQTGNVQVNYADRQFGHFIVRVFYRKSFRYRRLISRICVVLVVHRRDCYPAYPYHE